MATSAPHTGASITTPDTSWSTLHRHHIGIDIGGTTIKYAVVNTVQGIPSTPILQVPTPTGATPEAVAATLTQVVQELSAAPKAPHPEASVGVAFPAIIRDGVARSAANIDPVWLGMDVHGFLTENLGRPTHLLNDADAAGLAEIRYGAGRGVAGRPPAGTILVITLGTGIGSALFVGGKLVPNLELGHLELDGTEAEARASALAREREELDWPHYTDRLQRYFSHLEFIFSPDLFIVGGGISACHEQFLPFLRLNTPILPAQLRNVAGIIGAAGHAYQASPPVERGSAGHLDRPADKASTERS